METEYIRGLITVTGLVRQADAIETCPESLRSCLISRQQLSSPLKHQN